MRDMNMHVARSFWIIAVLLALVSTETVGQAVERLTLEDIHRSGTFSPAQFRGGKWADEGPIIHYIEREGDATHLVSYNLETDSRTRLIDGSRLFAPDVNRLVEIHDYAYSTEGDKVLIYTDSERLWRYPTQGYYYVFDRATNTLTPLGDREQGFQMFAKFDPEGRRVAFVRNRNLYVVDLETGQERALTDDGGDGTVINGTSDWVYEEEFGLRDGWHWSPDGRHIAFIQLDETETREFTIADYRHDYPDLISLRYPKAGERNSEVRVGVVNMDNYRTRFFDTGTWQSNTDSLEYIPQLGWTPAVDDTSYVWIFRMNRDQNVLDLLYGDPLTMETQLVLRERSDTWIDVDTGFSDLSGGTATFLEDGQFVWVSERSGFRHLYLYGRDGRLIRQLTSGDWDVTEFHGVDRSGGTLYFTSTAEGPMERHLYSAAFSGDGQPQRITQTSGWYGINASRDLRYFIGTFSDAVTPPSTSLHRIDGSQVTMLEDNRELRDRLARYDLREPEFMQVSGADGTMLNATVIKPREFRESERYPVLMYAYGGPGSQTVRQQWGGARYLWHQYLANELGLVVVSVDNRGTGGRGTAFKGATYRRLGQVEARDQISAARQIGELPYVDESRIGIWGWSYGGYLTLMAMLLEEGPSTFKLGMSVAPVTDWRFYDTIYTERYMSTPGANAVGYQEGSAIRLADRLSGNQRLLIVHGDLDDNVHYQNAVQMIDALQREGKQFDMMMYPGRDHGIAGGDTRLHLHRLMTNYIERNL
jgi:dipeptidyl-peptidase 4